MAVLHRRADGAAGAPEDLLAVLVAEVPHPVLVVDERQFHRQRVQDRGQHLAVEAEGQVAQLRLIDELLRESVVPLPRSFAERRLDVLDAADHFGRLGRVD